MSKRSIKFIIENGTKRPKAIDSRNSCFQIYSPEGFKIAPGEIKRIIINYSIHLPEDILSPFLVVATFGKRRTAVNKTFRNKLLYANIFRIFQ